MNRRRRAVFLDRDGVLNEVVERDGKPASPRSLDQFRVVPDLAAVNRLREAGLYAFIITNQPDVSRGHTPVSLLEAMFAQIRAHAHIDDVRACVHDDHHDCACRKPKPGMILDLAAQWNVDVAASYVIGDMWRDMDAARAAGCAGILLRREYNRTARADHTAASLTDAVSLILGKPN